MGSQAIEFKKGKIWLDLVRYSEMLLGSNPDAERDVLTLFFIPDGFRMERVIAVEKPALLAKLALTTAQAEWLLELRDGLPRSLNAQASLTPGDVREIAAWEIHEPR